MPKAFSQCENFIVYCSSFMGQNDHVQLGGEEREEMGKKEGKNREGEKREKKGKRRKERERKERSGVEARSCGYVGDL